MARILFSFESKMHRFPGDTQPSPHYYCMRGSAEALNKYNIATFLNDLDFAMGDVDKWESPEVKEKYEIRDERFRDACKSFRPDIVVATALVQLGPWNIAPETYGYVSDKLGIPVVMVWLESAQGVVEFADKYAPFVTANLFVDTKDYWRRHTKYPDKCRWMPEPKDPRVFYAYPDNVWRSILVSFGGSQFGRMERALNLAWLAGQGVEVKSRTGLDTPGCPSIGPYADLLRSSLTTLNFSSAVDFQHVNARVSEALMCGALLLETENDETTNLLDPFVHFVPFKEPFHLLSSGHIQWRTESDMVEKVRHYTGPGIAEARQIARQGHEAAMELFDGRKFWCDMMQLAGVE